MSAAVGDGWIDHDGSECPVAPKTMVEVRYRNGGNSGKPSMAYGFGWLASSPHDDFDIIAYRAAVPVPAAPVGDGVTEAGPGYIAPFAADGVGSQLFDAAEKNLAEYVYSPDEGSDHEPNDFERELLRDFLWGLSGDEAFTSVLKRAALASTQGLATPLSTEPAEAGPGVAISLSDPLVILAGIKQFGLASDGADLRDLEAAIERLSASPPVPERTESTHAYPGITVDEVLGDLRIPQWTRDAFASALTTLRSKPDGAESGVAPEHLSPLPWTYHNSGEPIPRDWIEDAHGGIVVEHVGHIDGPFIVASANVRSKPDGAVGGDDMKPTIRLDARNDAIEAAGERPVGCLWPGCDCQGDCDPDAVEERIEAANALSRAPKIGRTE